MSAIIDTAVIAGFELNGQGPALRVDGQIHDISDFDIETQRLLAKKAALEMELQRLRLETALATYQAAQWERQCADAVRRKTATLKRARAVCLLLFLSLQYTA